jgi:hypothetical protein
MDDIQIIYDAYSSSFDNPLSFEEFSSNLQSAGGFANEVLSTVYNWNDDTRNAVDRLLQGTQPQPQQQEQAPLEAEVVTEVETDPPKKPLTPAEQMFQDKNPFYISDEQRLETTTNVSLSKEDKLTKEISGLKSEIAKNTKLYPEYDELVNNAFRDESDDIDPDNPDQNIKAGPGGLTKEQAEKINNKFDRGTMFNPYQKQVYRSGVSEDGRMISGGSRITTTIQPYEEELKQAEKVIEKSLIGLTEEQKKQRIQDYVFNSLIKAEKEKQRTANWENYIEKEDSWVDYLAYISKFGGANRGGANTAHEKQVELIKKGIADKANLENKQAALAQLRRNRNINIIEQKQEDAFELNKLLEVINDPNLTYDLVPGEEYVTLNDGRNIPKYIYDTAQEQREELISLSNIIQNDEEQVKIAIEDANDVNTLLDITRRDYNDIKKFGVSLGLNSLDLLASTVYGGMKIVTAPGEIAASITGQNLGLDPLRDTYTAFTNWKYEVMDDYQKDIAFDDIGFDNWTNIGKWLTQSASQQLPIIISMVATGGISGAAAKAAGITGRTLVGVQNVSSSAMIGLSSMGGKINDMNYEEFISGEKKYSEAEKLIKGTMYGVAEGTFAYFSTAPMLNRGVNKLSGLGANAAQQEVRTGAFDYLRGTLRKDILPETAGEMFFEGLTTGTQNLIDGRPFFENMNETLVSAGIWGFGMSGTPALYVAGTRNFANNKELKLIQDRQAKKNELLKLNARLVDDKLKGNLVKATTDIDSEVNKNLEMIEVYDTEIVEAMNTVEENIKKKGMTTEAAKGYSEMQVGLADIRNKVLEVSNDPNKTEAQKESEIEALGNQYNEVSYYQNLFTQTETFGSLYASLAGSSIFQSPFSEKRKKYRKVTQQAKDNIIAKKGTDHKITRDEINTEAESILIDEKADVQLEKDKAQSKKLGHNFEIYQTKEQASNEINKLYNEAIETAGKETARGKKLLDQKIEVLQKINKGSLNGLSIQVKDLINLDFVVRDNMRTNRRFTTGLHEQTHRISKELIAANPEAFKNLGRQIISYLSFTGQNAALLKMNVDNANIKADGDYDYDEVVSSFMELIADEKVNLELMDNFVAATGKLFNEGLQNATDGKYNIEFTGENDILAYFMSFGKKLASGEIDTEQIQELKGRINKEGRVLKMVEAVESDAIAASETKATTNEALVDIINNPASTRRQRSEAIDTLVADNEGLILTALGFNKDIGDINAKELLDIVVKDQFLVKNMLGKFDKDRAKFSTYVFNLLKRRRKEIYEAAGLDATKFQTESLDKEEARQIADAKRPDFDENTDTDTGRELIPVEDLKIVTPELVDEVKDIVTRTLKRTALTKGVSTDAVLEDINKAIEKEITKVIKNKMGPITRNVLGFAPKQYIDFIRYEMMNIVGAMPTNVIKQKAKSKAWAEIFKLTEIGREDIKKVNPDTGKITNYRKQIFKLEKPDATKFQRYFTRGGYTTLIERQKSLIKPMAQQLARSELARLRQDKPFIQDLAQRTGMTDLQVTELFVDTVIKDIESELDNTASEILQQDTVKFSETLASASNQSKQTFIDGLRSPTFRAMLADSFNDTNVKNPITNAITGYFRGKGLFKDLTDKQIGDIARQFNKPAVQRQVEAEAKKVDNNELAAIVSEAFERVVENQNDYKAIELALGINDVDFDKKSIASVNIGRQMALKLAIKIGREKFIRLFAPGLQGPAGLAGLDVSGTPKSLELTESDVTGLASTPRTGLFKNIDDLYNNVINAKDANGNLLVGPSKGNFGVVSNKGNMDSRIFKKNWYFNKQWEDLSTRKEQLEYVNEIAKEGEVNKKIYRETIISLAGELTPTEARWLVSVDSGSMQGALKASASLIGFPDLNKKQLQKSLNLKTNDPYVLEHMTPAKYMALITYKYLLDPSSKNKNDFNTELDNFNTIILPEGIDDILRAEGKQAAMGLKHKIGDSPFDTRYDEVLKVMQIVKVDGEIIGESTSKYSETNNSRATKSFDANLVNESQVKFSESNQNTGISVIETEILDRALRISRDPNAPIKKIRVFDFDDTLALSKSKVFYEMPDGSKGELSAEQFADEGSKLLEEGAKFDFTDFDVVREGKPGPLLDIAKKIQKARGTGDLFVLTARAPESEVAIKEFLSSVGLEVPLENITGLGNSSGLAKSSWIVDKAAQGYNDFYFADDAIQNVEAVKRALDVIDVKSKVQQAKLRFSETVDQAMNDIIYQKTGIESFKEYSDVRAQAEGRGKRSFDLIPASAEDFGGLLYRMLGKGKVGDAQWEWMQDNLIKPYNRGVNDLVVAQNTLAADFRALKESLEGIPRNLKKKAFGGFTFEDVVRIHTWNKQGITVEGISKRDLKDVDEFVNQNPELDVFSDQLIAITKGDGYYYPGKNWLAGTITTDFREGLRTTSRAKYLAQWQANVDEAFSPKNLNKIEAAFGNKYREALEDSLQRMKTGTNRNQQMGRLESRFLDYINGSVGAVMFLNARSAVLQTISAINFINWGDNNVFAAGKAFANQPQYWKDFMTLMNSDYLVDRRNGLKINVSENEIAEAAKTSKNKAKAVISTLLSKGFVLTQIADSFAIASGGATFYRNRIKKLVKEGMSEAEATKQAFQDFKEVSETSQQSADPSKISQQQASTIGKIILAWGNTPMQYNRIIKKATLDLVNRRGDWKDNISKIVYYGALQNIIFTTLQTGLFAVAFGEDEEDDAVMQEKTISTINSLIDNLLRGMGIGGAVVSTIKNLGIEIYDRSKRKKPDYADVALKLLDVAPPVDVKVSKFRQGLTTYEYSQRDPRREEFFNVDNPSYSAAAKVIAATTNVPVDRLLQKAQNLENAMDDQNQWWKRAAFFLGWPEWQLRSTKEANEFRELMKERRKQYKEEKAKRQAAYKVSQMSDVEKASYDRAQDSISYVKLNKQEQVDKLDSLGLTKKEIRALRYEKDRVNKLLELME